MRAVLRLSAAAGGSAIIVDEAWAGWDERNAVTLKGDILDVRRGSVTERQMSRGWARMRRAEVTLRSEDGFAEWIAETATGQPDPRALMAIVGGLPLTEAARAAMAGWAGAEPADRGVLALEVRHPAGARVVALWNRLMFDEIDQYGLYKASVEGLEIDAAGAGGEATK
jgi:hypothetical protein